jgi:exosortase
VVYWQAIIDLLKLWTSGNPTYSHGLLLTLAAVWLTTRRWVREHPALRFSWFGTLCVAALSSAWVVADHFDVLTAERLAFALMPLAIMWSTLGLRAAARVGLPMALIVFAIPLWSVLNPILRPMTAHAVSVMMELVGVPSVADGTRVLVPAGTFEIAENCTGLRQLVVAMPLALIFAEMTHLRMRYAILLCGVSMVVSVVLNTLRIFVVVLSGQLTDMQHYFVTEDHVTLGWIMFAVGISLFLFAAGGWMPQRWHQSPWIGLRPVEGLDSHATSSTSVWRAGAVLLALILGPVFAHLS